MDGSHHPGSLSVTERRSVHRISGEQHIEFGRAFRRPVRPSFGGVSISPPIPRPCPVFPVLTTCLIQLHFLLK